MTSLHLRPPVNEGQARLASPRSEGAVSSPFGRRERGSQSGSGAMMVAVVITLGTSLLYGYGAVHGNGTGVGVLMVPLLVAVCVPVARRIDFDGSFDLSGLIVLSYSLKLLATYRRFVAGSDGQVYDEVGRDLAAHFRRLDFRVDTGRSIPGTGSIRYLTGLVHVVTGSNFLGTTLIFSTLGFIGMLLFLRAALVVGTGIEHRRYASLLLFWPSMLYWPSSIGKESIMILCLGMAAFGAAQLLTRSHAGLFALVAGLAGAAMIRPHVSLIVIASVSAALIVRAPLPGGRSAVAAKVLGIVVLVLAASLVAGATEETLKVDNLTGAGSLSAALDRTETQTSQGGASFNAARVTSPVQYPWAAITVLFRPFPNEAHSTDAMMSSAESLVLFGLLAASWRRVLAVVRNVRSMTYAFFAFIYTMTFIYLFAAIGNFGILTRQRTQVLPFVLVFVAIAYRPTTPSPQRRAKATWNNVPVMGGSR